MFVKVDPATLSSERGGRKERLIDRCHQKSPLFWQTLHNGESKWTNGMARLSPTIQLYSLTTTDSSLAAAASTVSWIQQLGWQHSGYRPDESGFQIKPIRRIQENASLLPINLFVKRKTHSACKWRSLLLCTPTSYDNVGSKSKQRIISPIISLHFSAIYYISL